MDFQFQRKRLNEIPKSRILDELEKVAKSFNYVEFSWRDFDKIAEISANTVKRNFGSWKKGLEALKNHLQQKGLDLSPHSYAPNRIYSDKDLFSEMDRIWQKIGQRPSRTEWEMSDPQISYNTYKQRFGGWKNACLKFIEYKTGGNILADNFVLPDQEEVGVQEESNVGYKQKSSRNVSLSLRLQVLSRDNFRCVFCGKSPATDIGTKLHIDHKRAFSKGGRSILENLQTLCQECNLGKSNNDIVMGVKEPIKDRIQNTEGRGGDGGNIFIFSNKITGNGLITVDGGDGKIGGNAGKVHINTSRNNFTGKISARGGKSK